MPKLLPPEYVLARPKPPTWWKRNRHVVTLVAGLLVGAWLVSDGDDLTPASPRPAPSHSQPGAQPDRPPHQPPADDVRH